MEPFNKTITDIPQKVISQGIKDDFKSIETNSEEPQIFANVKTVFYYPKTNKENEVIGAGINHREFIMTLNEMGFYLSKLGNEFILISIQNNVIREVTKTDVQENFIKYISSLPETLAHHQGDVKKKDILNNVYFSNSILFALTKLSLLPMANIDLNKDTKELSYFYYRNGFVECSGTGYRLLGYDNLKRHIWQSQIINRDFIDTEITSIDEALNVNTVFAQFMSIISGKNRDRLAALCSMAGYLMHNFFDTDLKAVILTDSKLSDIAEGRTGKGLFVKGLQQVRVLQDINGKDFKQDDKHKYQTLTPTTQIVHLDDLKTGFDVENLFNIVTGGIKVELKCKLPYSINAKMVITSNKTLNIQGSSAKGRTTEFELADYFSDLHKPSDEFKHFFFTDWEQLSEWSKFDNYMMFCNCFYLNNGLLAAEPINLVNRKVLDNTCQEFYEWIKDKDIRLDIGYDKKELQKEFLEVYEDLKTDKRMNTTKKFSSWLKSWANFHNLRYIENRSDNKFYIRFLKNEKI